MTLDELGPAGRAALATVKDALPREALIERAPTVEAYVLAVDLLARLQEEHARLGRPVLVAGARGHVASHPLPGEIRRQGRYVAEMAKALGITAGTQKSMTGRNLRAPDRLPKLRSVTP